MSKLGWSRQGGFNGVLVRIGALLYRPIFTLLEFYYILHFLDFQSFRAIILYRRLPLLTFCMRKLRLGYRASPQKAPAICFAITTLTYLSCAEGRAYGRFSSAMGPYQTFPLWTR